LPHSSRVDLKANLEPLPPVAELGWWYQYYFATERGQKGYAANRHDFNKLISKDRIADVGVRRRHVRSQRRRVRQLRSRRDRRPQLSLAVEPRRR